MSTGNGEIKLPQATTFKTSGPVHIDGIGALAQKLPDDNWYVMTLRIRKIPGGAEVQVSPKWERIP
jgi:hypothetical protein